MADRAEFLMETHKTIIYRLVIRNDDFDAFLETISYFWRENGRFRHAGAKESGASRPNQKVGPLDGPFRSNFILKTVFKNSGPEPPPLKGAGGVPGTKPQN